ncbi:hypothetical protein LTS09_003976 [Friedmanniomyces endolithicus]|nr:hypothetical protein LTS09_003976 [Friedmanniomyces endolithicus]
MSELALDGFWLIKIAVYQAHAYAAGSEGSHPDALRTTRSASVPYTSGIPASSGAFPLHAHPSQCLRSKPGRGPFAKRERLVGGCRDHRDATDEVVLFQRDGQTPVPTSRCNDGLENNDGIFVVASTNFLDRLDPGLSKRPSRFDRKYLFPRPNEHERTLYCTYWRQKLSHNAAIVFPAKLAPAMSRITPGFSFAFLQECFVATLLILARGEDDDDDDAHAARGGGGEDEGLEKYELWRVFRRQADILRKEVEGEEGQQVQQQRQGMLAVGWEEEEGGPVTPAYSAMSGEPTENDKTVRHDAWSRRADTGLPDLERLRVKDEVLAPLRYPSAKSEYINTAAMDHRL